MTRYSLVLALVFLGLQSGIAADAPAKNPVPTADAAGKMTLPRGFKATLFAGEPDLVQPIAFTIDDRGRLWVAECLSYPKWAATGNDRITIYEDTNGDGKFDKKKVFWDKGNFLTGLVLGHGGVWVCCAPNLLFIPDKDGDDVPDGPAEVVLDGWSTTGKHNVVNGLTWGPDGWLWGCNGITSPSTVGKPGAKAGDRTAINCGVWRYHPQRKDFEVVAHGSTNPWGLDFDDYGQAFITNCVISHLFHVVPGGHYKRMFGQDINNNGYDLMGPCSDHLHWGGGDWTSSRGGQGAHSEAGGGHAHSGAMVYLGDNWPSEYRNSIFMCNIHGNRVNRDTLVRSGSGYVGRHAADFLFANDAFFRGLALQYGPDGGVYVSDWSDTGECHDYDAVERDTGRLYKVVYGDVKAPSIKDVSKLTNAQLVELQLHANEFYVRHARRVLSERFVAGQDLSEAKAGLLKIFNENADVPKKLRALWALHELDATPEAFLIKQFAHPAEAVRQWAVRFYADQTWPQPGGGDKRPDPALIEAGTTSPVRAEIASALQRMPVAARVPLLGKLMSHAEDAVDTNLVLLEWYALEGVVAADADSAVRLLQSSKIPLLREYIARRLASQTEAKR